MLYNYKKRFLFWKALHLPKFWFMICDLLYDFDYMKWYFRYIHIYLFIYNIISSWYVLKTILICNLFYNFCRNNEIYMLGDVSKWIPASSTRIRSIVYQEADLLINLWGGANEEITIHYVLNGKLKSSTCPIKTTGWNCISMLTGKCVYWSWLFKKKIHFSHIHV